MIDRPFWRSQIEAAWKTAPIVWLSGVRRSGKTTLAQSLGGDAVYINCDLPVVEDQVHDPEAFYRSIDRPILVFDEIHQLKDPSRLLKIGADVFPRLKILATGSSTLAASHKFRDTLTGRKQSVHLRPVLWNELDAFHKSGIEKRLFFGGLPPTLLAKEKNPAWYREWMDSFFARDINRLFAVRDFNKFNTLFEYLLKQSGGAFEIAKAASALGLSRQTVETYTQALEITHAITRVRPFHESGVKELVKLPKVYGFDTGFVSYCRGWDPLRPADMGFLWEHMVLEFLQAMRPNSPIHYWRDGVGHELDFVLPESRDRVDVLECKWNPKEFDPANLAVFRARYRKGKNYLIVPTHAASHIQTRRDLKIIVCNPGEWAKMRVL